MADTKISALPTKATPVSADIIPIVDSVGTVNKKVTAGSLPISAATQTALNAKQDALGFTPENVANKDTDISLAADSNTLYPSQKAVKTYIDNGLSGKGRIIDVQSFTSSGTWTKPIGAAANAMVEIVLMSGSGGGGSGRRGAPGTVRTGGAGGAGAQGVRYFCRLSDLPNASYSVVVGAKGTGGAAVLTDDTNGAQGSVGGSTIFGGLVQSGTVGAGSGGSTAAASGGTAANGNTGFFTIGTSTGQPSSGSGGTGNSGGNASSISPCGSASGGGISSTNVASNGGGGGRYSASSMIPSGPSGGAAGTTTGTANGGQGLLVSGVTLFGNPIYTGPGGGASKLGAAAGAGADGLGNCGGAGGGASENGFNSGKGGDGTDGWAIIIVYS